MSSESVVNVSEISSNIFTYFTSGKFFLSLGIAILIIIICIVTSKIFKYIIRTKTEQGKMVKQTLTLAHVMVSIVKGVVIVIGIIVILQTNGIKVTGLITSVSIVSAVVGLALQDSIKDLVQGIHIISDHYFEVGDVIGYNGIKGEVISVSLKTVKVRNILNNNIMTISNRNISEIEKISNLHDIDIGLAYEEDIKKIYKVFQTICPRIAELDNVEDCIFKGIQDYTDSSITYKVRIIVSPKQVPEVHRSAMYIIQTVLSENGITIPYNQLDVHTK